MGRFDLEITVQIRDCREADLEALEWFGSLRGHRGIIREAYRRQRRGEGWMLVADVGGFPIGQLWIDLVCRPGVALLWAFRIMPPFRGHGIGTALLRAAEQLLRERGIGAAEIGVETWNEHALRLYRRSGFDVVGQEENSFETQVDSEPPTRHAFQVFVLRKALGA